MKRLGSIIITFYLICFFYLIYTNPMVIAWCVVSLGITLIIVTFIRDVVCKYIKSI